MDGLQIAEKIFDLLSGIEVDGAYNPVGNIFLYQFLLKDAGLGIGAVEYGEI